MTMYVAAVKEKWKTRWNSIYHKNRWFSEFPPSPLDVNVFILQGFGKFQPINDETQCSDAIFFI
jgi:hypothetical protein